MSSQQQYLAKNLTDAGSEVVLLVLASSVAVLPSKVSGSTRRDEMLLTTAFGMLSDPKFVRLPRRIRTYLQMNAFRSLFEILKAILTTPAGMVNHQLHSHCKSHLLVGPRS